MKAQYLILLLAGSSQRRGGERKKQFTPLNGKERFLYPLETFLSLPCFKKIILVLSKEDESHVRSLISSYPERNRIGIAIGGETRSESVYSGFKALEDGLLEDSFVFIHDADRPFVSLSEIESLIGKEEEASAIALISPIYDSILRKEGEKMTYIDRKNVYSVRTPQVFSFSLLKEILSQKRDTTDEFQIALSLGCKTAFMEGGKLSFKITDSKDLELAKRISLSLRKAEKAG